MTHFSKFTALLAISVAASLSATGCYAEVEDPTEENDVASADESAVAEESFAAIAANSETDEFTDAEGYALETWGRGGRRGGHHGRYYGHRNYYGGYYGGYHGYRGHHGYRGYGHHDRYRHGWGHGRRYGHHYRGHRGGYGHWNNWNDRWD
ncbi:MAG: hypothetical protein IPM54_32110 [Polyangiaceae bacterium]|nr:hypothetical protein [Polyangiaceae bacterium]